jgi:hypothetical protein
LAIFFRGLADVPLSRATHTTQRYGGSVLHEAPPFLPKF